MKKIKLDIQLFASGTIFESSDGKLRAKLTWSSSINEEGLGSTITATLSVRRTSGSGTTGTFKYNMEIDGETWSGSKKLTSLGTSYKEVASKTKSINYSGSYSAYLYAKVNGPTDTSLEGLSVSGDGYAPLDATSYPATLNSVNIDNFVSQGKFTPNFTINQSGLYYGMYIIAYTPSQTIVSWNSPIAVSNGVEANLTSEQLQALWNYLDLRENRTAVDIMFVLASYSNSSLSGDYQIGTSDIHFQNTIAIPSYSLQWDSATLGDTGMGTYYGGHPLYYYVNDMNSTFIKTLSTPYLRFSASSTTGYLYGKKITYTINGIARTSPYEDSSWDGTGSYTITASDGRVNSITTTLSKNVLDYFVPYLSNIRVVRPIPTDDVVRISYTANYYDGTGLINLTNAVYNFYYRESESDSWTLASTLSGTGTNGTATFTNVDIDNLNYKKPFYYKIEFTDRIGNTPAVPVYTSSIPKGLPVWNGYVNGSDDNVFNVNGIENVDGYIQQWNPDGRVGSGIIVRGNSIYPEASINYGNVNGNQVFIAGWGTAGIDGWNVWSAESGQNIIEVDKYGSLNVNGTPGHQARVRTKRNDTGADIEFGVGSGGVNRGIYDNGKNKWLFYTDNVSTFINPASGDYVFIHNGSYYSYLTKKFIRARQTTSQAPDSNGQLNVLFQAVDINTASSALELKTDGKITVISNDVHNVKVDCTMWVERGSTSYAWCHLWVGGTDICLYMIPNRNNGEVWQSVHFGGIASVSYGMQITPNIYFNVSDSVNGVKGGTYQGSTIIDVEVLD